MGLLAHAVAPHSCVPRSHSCERLGSVARGVRKSANTARMSARATNGSRSIKNLDRRLQRSATTLRSRRGSDDAFAFNVNRPRMPDAEEVADFPIVPAIVDHEVGALARFE